MIKIGNKKILLKTITKLLSHKTSANVSSHDIYNQLKSMNLKGPVSVSYFSDIYFVRTVNWHGNSPESKKINIVIKSQLN